MQRGITVSAASRNEPVRVRTILEQSARPLSAVSAPRPGQRDPPRWLRARSVVATSVATSRSSDASVSSAFPTIRTIWRDRDGYDTRVTRLRAWSGITGWRFESSSAHRKPCKAGLSGFPPFVPPDLSQPLGPWQHSWQHPSGDGRRHCRAPRTGATSSSLRRCSRPRPTRSHQGRTTPRAQDARGVRLSVPGLAAARHGPAPGPARLPSRPRERRPARAAGNREKSL